MKSTNQLLYKAHCCLLFILVCIISIKAQGDFYRAYVSINMNNPISSYHGAYFDVDKFALLEADLHDLEMRKFLVEDPGITLFINPDNEYFHFEDKKVHIGHSVGFQFGYKMSERTELSATIQTSNGKAQAFIPLYVPETDVSSGGTNTVLIEKKGLISASWHQWNAGVNVLRFFNRGPLKVGTGLGLYANFYSGIDETLTIAGQQLDLTTTKPGTSLSGSFDPVVQYSITDRLFICASLSKSFVLVSGNMPSPNLSSSITLGFSLGPPVQSKVKISRMAFQARGSAYDISESEEDWSGSGPTTPEARRELEAKRRANTRAVEAEQEGLTENQGAGTETASSWHEEPDGHLQAAFFNAVKCNPNCHELMTEFRKLPHEEAQKIVDGLYAASKASSAKYWANTRRHNEESNREYDEARKKFQQEFAEEWGALQWQLIEPMMDIGGAAVTLAKDAGLIDEETAKIILIAAALTGPAAVIWRGVRKGAQKMGVLMSKTATENADNVARTGRRSVDNMANTSRRNLNGITEGSLRSIETRCGIAVQDGRTFMRQAKDKGRFIIVRKGNPASLKHRNDPGYITKPVTCKPKTAKVGPQEGVVVDPTHDVQFSHVSDEIDNALKNGDLVKAEKLRDDYYTAVETWNKWLKDHGGQMPNKYSRNPITGEILYDNKGIRGDYDLHGVYQKMQDGSYKKVNFGDGIPVDHRAIAREEHNAARSINNGRRERREMNDALGREPIRHGSAEDLEILGEGNIIKLKPDPPVVVFTPDGKIIELETVEAMEQFYSDNGLTPTWRR